MIALSLEDVNSLLTIDTKLALFQMVYNLSLFINLKELYILSMEKLITSSHDSFLFKLSFYSLRVSLISTKIPAKKEGKIILRYNLNLFLKFFLGLIAVLKKSIQECKIVINKNTDKKEITNISKEIIDIIEELLSLLIHLVLG